MGRRKADFGSDDLAAQRLGGAERIGIDNILHRS